jgi:hypothetical protein
MTRSSIQDDPIFAAIEKYRKADIACDALFPKKDEGGPYKRTPARTAAVKRVRACRAALAKTSPTTYAGLTAVMDYCVQGRERGNPFFDGDEETEAFLRSLARAVKRSLDPRNPLVEAQAQAARS